MAHKNTFRYKYLLIQLHDYLLKMQKPLIYACIQTNQNLSSMLYCKMDILQLCIFALKVKRAKLLCQRISGPTKVGEISRAVRVLLLNIMMIGTVTVRDSDNNTFLMMVSKLTSCFIFPYLFSSAIKQETCVKLSALIVIFSQFRYNWKWMNSNLPLLLAPPTLLRPNTRMKRKETAQHHIIFLMNGLFLVMTYNHYHYCYY